MTRRFLENLEEDQQTVAAGDYDIEVVDARVIEKDDEPSKTMFLDLKIIGGPDDGRVTSVTLYVPEDGEKAVFHFRKKTRGFARALATIPADIDDEEQIQAIADALMGQRARARLDKQKKGKYAGSQELVETKPLDARAEPIPDTPEEAADEEPEAKIDSSAQEEAPKDEVPF